MSVEKTCFQIIRIRKTMRKKNKTKKKKTTKKTS